MSPPCTTAEPQCSAAGADTLSGLGSLQETAAPGTGPHPHTIGRPPRGAGTTSLYSRWSPCSGEKWGLGQGHWHLHPPGPAREAVSVWPWVGSRARLASTLSPAWDSNTLGRAGSRAHGHPDTFISRLRPPSGDRAGQPVGLWCGLWPEARSGWGASEALRGRRAF